MTEETPTPDAPEEVSITEDEAGEILAAAQIVTKVITDFASQITEGNVMAGSLSLVETAHAALLASSALAVYGTDGDRAGLDKALDAAREHLDSLATLFWLRGVELAADQDPDMMRILEKAAASLRETPDGQ